MINVFFLILISEYFPHHYLKLTMYTKIIFNIPKQVFLYGGGRCPKILKAEISQWVPQKSPKLKNRLGILF